LLAALLSVYIAPPGVCAGEPVGVEEAVEDASACAAAGTKHQLCRDR
jgi:hypothetical protein